MMTSYTFGEGELIVYNWVIKHPPEAALTEKRQNNNQNTEKSLSYFRKSDEDYQKAEELIGQ